ncbi:hypothetical protein M407DRAFT_11248 [Tulasnella calospora MUT 4182]|uniref:Uncharacterized protein n=1 Tax=Tulasnella calospora MUT 4182 TaxID=1051891 RepID=A0A0C3LE61_9AGAM|nr:hypothetical protein M407DRAFT_11248 [Tulasnella calospora MUT 4182]
MATRLDYRPVPRLSITPPSPSKSSPAMQLRSQNRPLAYASRSRIAGSNGPYNSANFSNMVIASDLNFQNGVSGANNARHEASFVPASSFEPRPPFRPAPATESTAYQARPTNTNIEPPARKRKHVEMTRELESSPSSGRKRTRLPYDSDTRSDDLGTVSPTDETAFPTPMSTAPEAQSELPDLEPLGPVIPLDVADTIQRALDALDQLDVFKQKISNSPTRSRRHPPQDAAIDQEGSCPAVEPSTASPPPIPPSPQHFISSEDDLSSSSLPTPPQVTQAQNPPITVGLTTLVPRLSTVASCPSQHPNHYCRGGNCSSCNPESGPSTRPMGSIPSGVLDAFKAHRPLLERGLECGRPELYETWCSFWIPRKSNFFVLMGASTASENAVTTSGGEGLAGTTLSVCNPSFFFWDPMAIALGGIRCPSPGCSKPLRRSSLVEEPRRVVFASTSSTLNSETMYDGMFWIVGVRYRCTHCAGGSGLSYESWDSRLLPCLPALIRAEFPAVERDGQLVALPHVDPSFDAYATPNIPSSATALFGDNPANPSFASLEPSQPPKTDSPSLTWPRSFCQAFSPSVTLQGENSSPETSVAPPSTPSPGSPSSPNTSITEGTLSSERATAAVIEDLSSSAPTSRSLIQTQPFPSRNTSHSTNSPNPVNLQKGRAKASTASDKESRRKRRSTVNTAPPQFLILVPPLTVRKNTLMSDPTPTHPSTFSYRTLDHPRLPLSPAVPPAAVDAQHPVDGPSTSTSTKPASLTKASQVEEDAPAKPKKPRTPRRCSKCGVKGCKGGNQVKLCRNPCVGCGQVNCDKPHTSKKQNLCVALLVGPPAEKGGREE